MQKGDSVDSPGQQKDRPKTGSNGRPDDGPGGSSRNLEYTGVARSTTELLGHALLIK